MKIQWHLKFLEINNSNCRSLSDPETTCWVFYKTWQIFGMNISRDVCIFVYLYFKERKMTKTACAVIDICAILYDTPVFI